MFQTKGRTLVLGLHTMHSILLRKEHPKPTQRKGQMGVTKVRKSSQRRGAANFALFSPSWNYARAPRHVQTYKYFPRSYDSQTNEVCSRSPKGAVRLAQLDRETPAEHRISATATKCRRSCRTWMVTLVW